jgi:hypothetical protein
MHSIMCLKLPPEQDAMQAWRARVAAPVFQVMLDGGYSHSNAGDIREKHSFLPALLARKSSLPRIGRTISVGEEEGRIEA